MFVIPIYIEAGVCGFESPAAQYSELGISLDELLIKHPDATFIGVASGCSMQEIACSNKGGLQALRRRQGLSQT